MSRAGGGSPVLKGHIWGSLPSVGVPAEPSVEGKLSLWGGLVCATLIYSVVS